MKSAVAHHTQEVGEEVVRRVISSLGFPADRIEKAVLCLFAKDNDENGNTHIGRVMPFCEVQHVLGISKSGLRRLVASGSLVPVNVTRRRIGFTDSDVAAFIEAHRRTSISLPGDAGVATDEKQCQAEQ